MRFKIVVGKYAARVSLAAQSSFGNMIRKPVQVQDYEEDEDKDEEDH
jgi:hypothetical protein